MTNIVEQLFKSLDPWPGFQITSFKIQVSPVDGRKTLILDLRPVEGSMPICSRCRHEAPLVHGYVSRRIKERSLLGYFVELNVTLRRVDCLHCLKAEKYTLTHFPAFKG
jgi:transposase